MKKSAIAAIMCFSFLTGCGKMDPVQDDPVTPETTAVEKETVSSANTTAVSSSVTTSKTEASPTVSGSSSTTTTASQSVAHGGITLTVPKRTERTSGNTTKHNINTSTETVVTVATTTTTAVPVHTLFSKGRFEFRVTTEGVEVFVDDKRIQTIETDTEELLEALADIKTEMRAQLIIEDVDLDGYDDLFIPHQIGNLNTFGVYYHYDSDEEKFVKWDELETIDSHAEIDEDNKTFTTHIRLSDDEYETRVFGWKDKEPDILTLKKQYRSTENKDDLLIDYFEYTDGAETLVKRERVLFDADGREAGAEEIGLD